MMLVDSHCHLDQLDLDKYNGDLSAAISAAKDNAVTRMLCVSIDLENFPNVLKVSEDYDYIDASVGVHPNVEPEFSPAKEQLLELSQHPKIVAIGETGLDYYRSTGDLTWQQDRFRTHIAVAREVHKPLIVHTRDAKADTLAILREEKAEECGGVLHCFTEDWPMAEAALDLGFYISFSGIVTFKNAKVLQDVAQRVPLDRMLIETDSPYLAPVPYRGKPNEPAHVLHVAEFIAELRDMSLNEVAHHTTENYLRLFIK